MSNLVPWKGNLPDTKKTKKKEKRSLKKAKSTGNAPMSFDEAMNALKEVSGHVEYRIIPMRCGKDGRPFAVLYKRAPDDFVFRVEKIVTEAPATTSEKPGLLARHFAGETARQAEYDHTEFDFSGRVCPWCGDRENIVNCSGCGHAICFSSVTRDANGQQHFACPPPCGRTGTLTPTTKVKASKARKAAKITAHAYNALPMPQKATGAHKSLPAPRKGSGSKALPPPGQKFLPGK